MVEMAALYREELDNMKCECGVPSCEDPILFAPACHHSPTWATYFDGFITITCATCDTELAKIAVAKKQNS